MADPDPQTLRKKLPESGASPFYIPATAATSLYRPRSLKSDGTFLLADHFGDCAALGPSAEGLFHEDTRYLSRLILKLNASRPLLLSSTVSRNNEVLRADLTNPDIYRDGQLALARDSLHLLRSKVLDPGRCTERIELRSYAGRPIEIELTTEFACDFADIFEVRGQHRTRRGRVLDPKVGRDEAVISYQGLDDVVRHCRIAFSLAPDELTPEEARYRLSLAPQQKVRITMTVACWTGEDEPEPAGHPSPRIRAAQSAAPPAGKPGLVTSNERFNDWIARSRADLAMLITETQYGPYPYGGIPWFSTAFGRDGIIAALECLWLLPELARGVLCYLAATQAQEADPASDAEPGKILHETRQGEMAALGEVPFRRYYGSIDATPLFVMLAAAYWERTDDLAFIRTLWPHILAALTWMQDYGDRDGDGFLEYARGSETGLVNQGWKDSSDSIFDEDGRLAEPPIALVEVQGYAYAAWRGAARLARALGRSVEAVAYRTRADRLHEQFEAAFWCEEIGTYVLALDGAKRPCRVRASNAGHALFAGIATPENAERVAAALMSPSSFSGWGIRTIAEGEPRYNPMSYHNGSVWPHDNGLIAMGFARYGLREPLLSILGGLFDSSQFMDLHRLPELFCGFARRRGEAPTSYPVACIPQVWSAVSVFAILGALLGISFEPRAERVLINRPVLPDSIDEVRVSRILVGTRHMDLLFRRHVRDVGVNVLAKEGEAEVVLTTG